MFQKKVIAVDSESDHDTEDVEPVSHKRAKVDDELQREKDALRLCTLHLRYQ